MSTRSRPMEPIGKHDVADSEGKESGYSLGGGKSDSQEIRVHRRKNSVELFPPQMTNKMKGLFKGLRYISQIFEPNEKEHEMQIGLPTDVKHVAHIGWDGPSVSAPTWMNEFKSGSDSSRPQGMVGDVKDQSSPPKWAPQDIGVNENQSRDLPELPKPSRRHHSSGSTHSRSRDSTEGSRQSRRQQNTGNDGESVSGDRPVVPKSTRRKKSKAGSGGSTRAGRSKAASDPDIENPVSPATNVAGEENDT